jgi:HD-GYP domain-containing protein (c-di-GMP phosphodiesterase class II)
MEKGKIRLLINRVLSDVEEEDIGISLLSRQYQNQHELAFFNAEDQDKILKILEKLSKDSERHKQMLQELVEFLGEQLHE